MVIYTPYIVVVAILTGILCKVLVAKEKKKRTLSRHVSQKMALLGCVSTFLCIASVGMLGCSIRDKEGEPYGNGKIVLERTVLKQQEVFVSSKGSTLLGHTLDEIEQWEEQLKGIEMSYNGSFWSRVKITSHNLAKVGIDHNLSSEEVCIIRYLGWKKNKIFVSPHVWYQVLRG